MSLTQNKEIRIPESLGNKPDEKSSYEPTTGLFISNHGQLSLFTGSERIAVYQYLNLHYSMLTRCFLNK